VRPLQLDPGSRIDNTTPTLMFFPHERAPVYGSRAIEAYLENDMNGRFIQSIKRHLPSPGFMETEVGGRIQSIEELVAGFLEHLKRAADAAAGRPVDRVLMGRPARFHADDARDALAERRLESAALMAGFREVAFQIEPIAAARAFERQLDREVLCLVGDLGGGTSDFTVIRLGPERAGRVDRRADVLGVSGVAVAGNDFDARLVWKEVTPLFGRDARYRPAGRWVAVPTKLHYAMTRWHSLCFASTPQNLRELARVIRTSDDEVGLGRLETLLRDNLGYLLFQSVEAAKVGLSSADAADLTFDAGGSAHGDILFSRRVTRSAFEAAIEREVGAMAGCLDGLLDDLGLTPDDVGVVFLTGGSSRVPRVMEIFRRRFGDRIVDQDVFTSVGLGLGIEAGERLAA